MGRVKRGHHGRCVCVTSRSGMCQVSLANMKSIFSNAKLFNIDISNWDVSSVTNMDVMFSGAASFTHTLCGTAWANSKATKEDMFVGSFGSISQAVCDHCVLAAVQNRAPKCHRHLPRIVPTRRLLRRPAWTNRGVGRVQRDRYERHLLERSIVQR